MMKGLFVSHRHSLSPGGGGQQVCTREYRGALDAAGFELETLTFETDRAPLTRLRRKLRPRPYADHCPPDLGRRVAEAVGRSGAAWVFLNLYNLIPLAGELRARLGGGARLVLLSHGLHSVDELHALRASGDASPWPALGRMLQAESSGLPHFDHVFCLAPFEVEICRWLGARSVSWWPRTIPDETLEWRPQNDRVGCIGTMDHPPNREGIELFLKAFAPRAPTGVRVRLISRSAEVCERVAGRYPCVDYLGPLEDEGAVRGEASTWNAFLHPIFCYAMGCSTKVATGLGWRIPVLTTRAGLRGYRWKEGEMRAWEAPDELAAAAVAAFDQAEARRLREEIVKVAAGAPDLAAVGAEFRRALGPLVEAAPAAVRPGEG